MVEINQPANDQFQTKPDSKSLVELVIEGMKEKRQLISPLWMFQT